jgi:hypothetical protein
MAEDKETVDYHGHAFMPMSLLDAVRGGGKDYHGHPTGSTPLLSSPGEPGDWDGDKWPEHLVDHPVIGGTFANVDMVVASDGTGSDLTLFGGSGALERAIATGENQIIWICSTHIETIQASHDLSALGTDQRIVVLSAGGPRPVFTVGTSLDTDPLISHNPGSSAGSGSLLRFQGMSFTRPSTDVGAWLEGGGGYRLPNLELIDVEFDGSASAWSILLDVFTNASSATVRNFKLIRCKGRTKIDDLIKTRGNAATLGDTIIHGSEFASIDTIQNRNTSTAPDIGINILITDTVFHKITGYAWQRTFDNTTGRFIFANNVVEDFTAAADLINLGTSGSNNVRDAVIADNFIYCSTGGAVVVQITDQGGVTENVAIVGNALRGPGSGTAILVDTSDDVLILNSYRDWDTNVGGAAAAGTGGDHGLLSGLSDDDHSIYALLAGRSGGQALIGGTGSGDDLTLESTSDATKGSVQIVSGTTFEVNDANYALALVSSNPRITFAANDYFEYNRSSNYFSWVIGSTEYARLNATKLDLLNSAYLDANDVQLPLIGSPTFTHLQHMNTLFHSAGWFSGGTISDAGSATINVTSGTGAFRASDGPTAQLRFGDWAASNGLAITANSIRYIGVEDGTPPAIVVRETNNFNFNTDFPLGTVVNESGTLHVQNTPWEIGDHADFMIQRLRGTMPIARDKEVGGLIFSETGTRNVVVTAGQLWRGLTPFVVSAIDTDPGGAADTFDTYSADGRKATGVAAWPNEQYDDGDSTLQDMDNNRWANLWWYIELDGELVMVYGTNQYTSAAKAGEEATPNTLPNRLQVHAILAARFIFQKSAGTAGEILSAFDTPFSVLGVTDHGNLAGLADDDHTQYLLVAGSRAMTGDLNMDGSNIDNGGVIFLKEQAEADGNVAGSGQLWVNTATPNELYFTDDADNDREIAYAGGAFHDGFSDFVGNEHIDHTSVTLTAGVGLSGGGDISANRTFTVDLNELTTETSIAADDFLAMVDVTDSGSGKITFANLEAALDHGSIAGLGDDDHSVYALLAGRSGGQTLIGGTASGEDLTLQSTAHATRGSVFLGSSSKLELNETTGQLKLPTTGANAGLLIGTDVQLYRSAENVLALPAGDNLDLIQGYIQMEDMSPPVFPGSGEIRVFARISGSRMQLVGVGLTGEECIICDVANVAAPAAVLTLNWIE